MKIHLVFFILIGISVSHAFGDLNNFSRTRPNKYDPFVSLVLQMKSFREIHALCKGRNDPLTKSEMNRMKIMIANIFEASDSVQTWKSDSPIDGLPATKELINPTISSLAKLSNKIPDIEKMSIEDIDEFATVLQSIISSDAKLEKYKELTGAKDSQ